MEVVLASDSRDDVMEARGMTQNNALVYSIMYVCTNHVWLAAEPRSTVGKAHRR